MAEIGRYFALYPRNLLPICNAFEDLNLFLCNNQLRLVVKAVELGVVVDYHSIDVNSKNTLGCGMSRFRLQLSETVVCVNATIKRSSVC